MTDFHDAMQARQSFVVDLIFIQQFGVIPELAQEPVHLPHGLCSAVEATDDQAAGQVSGFEDCQAKLIEGLVRVPV